MCGIFGYNGGKEASSILLGGLYRLEYRGYDSAGVAILSETGVHRSRVAGRVEALEAHLKTHPLPPAGVGIAHRGETEYLKAIPNGNENDNLGNLPSVSPKE